MNLVTKPTLKVVENGSHALSVPQGGRHGRLGISEAVLVPSTGKVLHALLQAILTQGIPTHVECDLVALGIFLLCLAQHFVGLLEFTSHGQFN